jgi:hypothetical protein
MEKAGASRPFSRLACTAVLQCILFIFPSGEKWSSLEWLNEARAGWGADAAGSRILLRAGIRYIEHCRMLPYWRARRVKDTDA